MQVLAQLYPGGRTIPYHLMINLFETRRVGCGLPFDRRIKEAHEDGPYNECTLRSKAAPRSQGCLTKPMPLLSHPSD